MSPLFLKIGMSVLCLPSSGILPPLRMSLNNLVKRSSPTSSRISYTSTGMLSGPTAFPFFIFISALYTSSFSMFWIFPLFLQSFLPASASCFPCSLMFQNNLFICSARVDPLTRCFHQHPLPIWSVACPGPLYFFA